MIVDEKLLYGDKVPRNLTNMHLPLLFHGVQSASQVGDETAVSLHLSSQHNDDSKIQIINCSINQTKNYSVLFSSKAPNSTNKFCEDVS